MPSTARIERVYVESVYDEQPDLSWLEQDYNDPSITPEEATRYRAEDAARLDAFHRGDWYMVGVRLAADVRLVRPGRVDKIIRLTTPGIWGIESDSDVGYLGETAFDEFDMLADDLRALGFADDEILTALGGDPETIATFAALDVVERP